MKIGFKAGDRVRVVKCCYAAVPVGHEGTVVEIMHKHPLVEGADGLPYAFRDDELEAVEVDESGKVICPNCDGEGRVPPFEPWDSEMVDAHPKYRNMSSWPQCPKCKGHGCLVEDERGSDER